MDTIPSDDNLSINQAMAEVQIQQDTEHKQLTNNIFDKLPGPEILDEIMLEQVDYLNDKLPPEILSHIFEYCDDSSVLISRLVCKHWKNAIDNDPKIMERFTFNIYDWHNFNESTIVDKVKSIRISNTWDIEVKNEKEEEMANWLEFAKRIGQIIKKIKFEFNVDDKNPDLDYIKNCSFVMCTMLSVCIQLNELHILNTCILQDLSSTISSMPSKHIKILVLDLDKNEDPELIKTFIGYFPNVVKIKFTKCLWKLNGGFLFEFIKANNGSLKEISLYGYGIGEIVEWTKFRLISANQGIKIYFNNTTKEKIHKLLTYEETTEAPVNERTCQVFEDVTLTFKGSTTLDTTRLVFCTNINYLEIKRVAKLRELFFLKSLVKLECMILDGLFQISDDELRQDEGEEELEDHDNHIRCPTEAFNCGLSSLHDLYINGDLFGRSPAEAFISFHLYYPNLKKLTLFSLNNLPEHLFVYLSKLQYLEVLHIDDGDKKLTDQMFIELCESQRQAANDDDLLELVPAIEAFNRLKKLIILNCEHLTEICIVQGIALSKTLNHVEILQPRKWLTADLLAAMTNANFRKNGAVFERGCNDTITE